MAMTIFLQKCEVELKKMSDFYHDMKSKKNTVPIIFQPKKEDCDIKTITYVGLFF